MAYIPFLNNAYFSAKVGIGTDSPDTLIHASAGSGATLKLESTTTTLPTGGVLGAIEFETQDAGSEGVNAKINTVFENTVGATSMQFFTSPAFSTITSTPQMVIDSAGNVGIGETSPDRLLELSKSVSGGQGATLRLTNIVGGAGAGVAIEFNGPGSQGIHSKIKTEDLGAFDSNLIFQTKATGTGGALADRLTIDNVGAIQFNDYGAGLLQTDASGNVTSGGVLPGGPYLPLTAGSSYPLTDTLYVQKNGNKNNGTISMGLGGSGTSKWSFLTGTHYNQATGSGNGTGSAGMAIIGSLATETYNKIYIGGGPYEINAATQIDFWTNSSTLSTTGGTQKGYVDSSGNWYLGNTLWVDAADDYVGIGTTTPGSKLEVNVIDDGFDDIDVLRLKRTWATGSATDRAHGILFNDINSRMATIYADRTNSGSNYNSQLLFSVNSGASGTSMITPMVINNLGRVGIETLDPDEKLHVVGNIKITAALLSNQENTDVDTGTETVANVAIATYTAAFFDFVVKKGTNVRSGTVYACHDGTNVEFTETSTNDLGDTSDVTLSVDISGTNMRLLATVTSDDWSVKSLIRAI